MTEISTTEKPKKRSGIKKFMFLTTFIILAVLAFIVYWRYYNTFSDGNRSGMLQKFSRKGNIFKTYEGEMVLSSIASTNGVALASEKFFFSVANDSIAKVVQNLEGKQVKLHYLQKRAALPWRGESNYIVDEVLPEVKP